MTIGFGLSFVVRELCRKYMEVYSEGPELSLLLGVSHAEASVSTFLPHSSDYHGCCCYSLPSTYKAVVLNLVFVFKPHREFHSSQY